MTENRTRLMRVMSAFIAACTAVSMTACGDAPQQDDSRQSESGHETEAPIVDIPQDPPEDPDDGYWHDDSSESARVSHNVQPENGTYTYNVYGYTVSMDVNIEDYISSGDSGKVFKIARMAYDLGWVGNDIYTAVDSDDWRSYSSEWYAHHDGDMKTRIDLGYYNEEQIPGRDGSQFRTINVRFQTDDNSYYYASGDSDILHRSLTCGFGKHYDDCEYLVSGVSWYASYEDIVMITYMFWSAAENAGSNPLVPVFGSSGSYVTGNTSQVIEYNFP